MTTNDEDRVLEVLEDVECRRLLRTARVGRLAFTDGALPAIVPVAFSLDEEGVLIPASEDNRVVAAVRGSVVALAVDTYDVGTRTGWGVTVVGHARVIAHYRSAAPAPSTGRCSIVVRMGLLRGWRMSLPAEPRPRGDTVTTSVSPGDGTNRSPSTTDLSRAVDG